MICALKLQLKSFFTRSLRRYTFFQKNKFFRYVLLFPLSVLRVNYIILLHYLIR